MSTVYHGRHAEPRLATKQDQTFRTRIREAAREPVNFAGEWIIGAWGCGSNCNALVAINARTGKVVWPGFVAMGGYHGSPFGSNVELWETRTNSNLLVINGMTDENQADEVHHYFTFDGNSFTKVATISPGKAKATVQQSSEPDISYIGTWAEKLKNCNELEEDYYLIFEARKMAGHEQGCKLTSVERSGNTWTVKGDCEYTEDDKWKTTLHLNVNNNKMTVRGDNGRTNTLLRCPR